MFRKSLVMLIFFFCFSFADTDDMSVRYEVKILERIVMDITNKTNPKICVIDYPISLIQKFTANLTLTSCKQADVIISSTDRYTSYGKPVVVVGHIPTKDEDVVGAIFWRKGRPQLILIDKNIKKFQINLPEEYKKFLIKENFTDYAKTDT